MYAPDPVQLDQELFDIQHASLYSEMMQGGDWQGMIGLCKKLILEANPTQEMRVELLTGIAMAQVGMAAEFTKALEEQGLILREQVGITPDEARQVMENVQTCIKLKADGLGQVTFPPKEI